MSTGEEAALLIAAQAGDERALDQLLRKHQAAIYAVCLRITANRDDAADATQNALIGMARGLASFDGRSRMSTWAHRIAANAALDEVRRRKRRAEPTELPFDSSDGDSGPRRTGGGLVDADPATRLDVEAALARLPLDFRAAVVLRDLCGLDYAEIGEVLGIPPGTVRSRIARGRAALVPLLEGNPAADGLRPRKRP